MASTTLDHNAPWEHLADFKPTKLRQFLDEQIPRLIASDSKSPQYDPVMKDLLKFEGRSLPTGETPTSDITNDISMEQLSLRLTELLSLLMEPGLDDDSRSYWEQLVKNMVSSIPKPKDGPKKYPNDYLSRILIDNYQCLMDLSTSYFNLSLSSLITRFLVNLVYNLECWEVYHLLNVIPNLESFLSLLEFDIKQTPFGNIVKPPSNYMNYNLRQGLQYPFPFPFYNFSYHPVNTSNVQEKMNKVPLKPYIDLRLEKSLPKKRRDKTPVVETPQVPKPPPVVPSKPAAPPKKIVETSREYRIKAKHSFIIMNEKRIEKDYQTFKASRASLSSDEEEYTTDQALSMMREEEKEADRSLGGFPIVHSLLESTYQAQAKKRQSKPYSHQCTLLDEITGEPCMKLFYGRNELQRHQEFVHATKKKIYRCQFCFQNGRRSQSYPRHDSLARHIRRKHGITGRKNKLAVILAKQNAEFEDGSLAENPQSATRTYAYPPMAPIQNTSWSGGAPAVTQGSVAPTQRPVQASGQNTSTQPYYVNQTADSASRSVPMAPSADSSSRSVPMAQTSSETKIAPELFAASYGSSNQEKGYAEAGQATDSQKKLSSYSGAYPAYSVPAGYVPQGYPPGGYYYGVPTMPYGADGAPAYGYYGQYPAYSQPQAGPPPTQGSGSQQPGAGQVERKGYKKASSGDKSARQ